MEDKLLCGDKDKVPCRRGKARKGDCIVEKNEWMMPAGIKALAVCEPRLWP